MEKQDFQITIATLQKYSDALLDNQQYGNSRLILADIEMVKVMADQSDQTATLIQEIRALRTTTEKANLNSGKLADANYRLQIIMLVLTAIGAVPVLTTILKFISTLLPNQISADLLGALAGIISALTAILLSSHFRRNYLQDEYLEKKK